MSAIARYIETDDYGVQTGRQLIALRDADLPPSADRARWQKDPTFDLAKELLASPSFKEIVTRVLKSGSQIVLKAKGK